MTTTGSSYLASKEHGSEWLGAIASECNGLPMFRPFDCPKLMLCNWLANHNSINDRLGGVIHSE
jgi:hypothetical protein